MSGAAGVGTAGWAGRQDALVRDAATFGGGHSREIRARLAGAGVDPADLAGVADLPRVPVLSKDALPGMQVAEPPFAGMLAVPVTELVRIFTSPGPILDPQGPGEDFWRFAPALEAAGFRAGQVVLNTFSYHLTPGGLMLDAGLRALGCVVIPGGVGNTDAQVDLARAAGATGYVGTPQFLAVLLEAAAERGLEFPLERAAVTGGPFLPDVRAAVGEHGVDAYECYGTADAGTLGFECAERSGWHVAPEVVVEVVDPATGEPVPVGERGEVVVTSPNRAYPLVRFGTGDLSAFVPGVCDCGRPSGRLKGFLGRSGEGVKVKGMFVHPRQVAAVLTRFPQVTHWRGVVTAEGHLDRLTVQVEADVPDVGPLEAALQEAVKLSLDVEAVPAGSLPREGRRLVDEREV